MKRARSRRLPQRSKPDGDVGSLAALPHLLLLPTQVNTVGQLISAAGLDPREFQWETTYTQVQQLGVGQEPVMVSRLLHKPTGFQFVFDLDASNLHHNYYAPGRDTPYERNAPALWEGQLTHVELWLGYLKREYEAPDLWGQLQRRVGELPPPDSSANTPFTDEERGQVEHQLRAALESAARTNELTADQLRALEEKVDYVVEATRRLGRLDWRHVYISVMAEEIFRLALGSDMFRDLVGVTLRGLGHLFGGPEIPALP